MSSRFRRTVCAVRKAPLTCHCASIVLGLFAVLATGFCCGSAGAQQKPNEILIGPVAVPQQVQGITVTGQVSIYMSLRTDKDGLYLDARVVADLADLQGKIASIIDTVPLPTNNCASYKPDNLVARIWGKQLLSSSSYALLVLKGDVDVWQCLENPMPNSKVEWVNDGPFGLSRPKVVTWPGDPIKNKGVNQPFDLTLPLTVQVVDERTAALRFDKPDVHLGGQYAFLTNGILRLGGIDVNTEAKKALDRAIDPGKFQAAIPSEYAKLNPTLRDASFGDVGGHLVLSMALSAALPPAELTELINTLLAQLKEKK